MGTVFLSNASPALTWSFTATNGTGDGGSPISDALQGSGSTGIDGSVLENDITGPNTGTDVYQGFTTYAVADKWGGAMAAFKANV